MQHICENTPYPPAMYGLILYRIYHSSFVKPPLAFTGCLKLPIVNPPRRERHFLLLQWENESHRDGRLHSRSKTTARVFKAFNWLMKHEKENPCIIMRLKEIGCTTFISTFFRGICTPKKQDYRHLIDDTVRSRSQSRISKFYVPDPNDQPIPKTFQFP